MSPGTVARDGDGLRAVLARVDAEGWDSEVGRTLLVELKHTIVLPLVVKIGLQGVAAEQAAATGWAAGWEVLRLPSTRAAASPWGVVWSAVRRAILNERITAAYATAAREAWRQEAEHERPRRLVSIDRLVDAGREPTYGGAQDVMDLVNPGLLTTIVGLMVEVGWPPKAAAEVMEAIADAAPWTSDTGWRRIARNVDAQPWQVRRLIAVVRHPAVAKLARDTSQDGSRQRVRSLLHCTMRRRPTERMTDLGLADSLAS